VVLTRFSGSPPQDRFSPPSRLYSTSSTVDFKLHCRLYRRSVDNFPIGVVASMVTMAAIAVAVLFSRAKSERMKRRPANPAYFYRMSRESNYDRRRVWQGDSTSRSETDAPALWLGPNGKDAKLDSGDHRLRPTRLGGAVRVVLLALLAVLVAAIASGTAGANHSSGTQASASPSTCLTGPKKLKFTFIHQSPPNIATAAKMIQGMKAADAAFNTDSTFVGPPQLSWQADQFQRMLQTTLAKHPDGLMINDYAPDSLNKFIKQFSASGIPVLLVNAGNGSQKATGALTFIGFDDYAAGAMGARGLDAKGAKRALWVTVQPGIPYVDARGKGFTDTFKGKVTTLGLPISAFSNPINIRNAIEAAIQKDKSIDSVYMAGDGISPSGVAARARLGERGKQIKWATIDLGKPVLDGIKSGDFLFGVDQEAYLQTFLGVQTLAMYIRCGFTPPPVISTGPAMVDSSNINQIIKLSGTGVR
jgi:simple sugar transport system substrate-binding protein